MRVGVMQAASQKGKNPFLEKGVRGAVPDDWEVINFGVFPEEESDVSYVEVALCAGLLLESGAVDCIVTGCSSGQGMALALNSLPGVVCGYTPTPADAFLFGRINGGNAISYPLGLGWGWNGELNFNATVQAFFDGPFGEGYPPGDAPRKRRDMDRLRGMARACRVEFGQAMERMDPALVRRALNFANVFSYMQAHGTNVSFVEKLAAYR